LKSVAIVAWVLAGLWVLLSALTLMSTLLVMELMSSPSPGTLGAWRGYFVLIALALAASAVSVVVVWSLWSGKGASTSQPS